MKLFPESILSILRSNGETNEVLKAEDGDTKDFMPAVKIFNPTGAGTWLFTEIDPNDDDLLFGLCDLGMGCPEMGYQSRSELERFRGPLHIGLERDLHFRAEMTLTQYAEAARKAGGITV